MSSYKIFNVTQSLRMAVSDLFFCLLEIQRMAVQYLLMLSIENRLIQVPITLEKLK